MRPDDRVNPAEEKRLARKRYAERQIDKWVKWSFTVKGKIKFNELIEMQNEYKLYN
jgi:hypothetical protein